MLGVVRLGQVSLGQVIRLIIQCFGAHVIIAKLNLMIDGNQARLGQVRIGLINLFTFQIFGLGEEEIAVGGFTTARRRRRRRSRRSRSTLNNSDVSRTWDGSERNGDGGNLRETFRSGETDPTAAAPDDDDEGRLQEEGDAEDGRQGHRGRRISDLLKLFIQHLTIQYLSVRF